MGATPVSGYFLNPTEVFPGFHRGLAAIEDVFAPASSREDELIKLQGLGLCLLALFLSGCGGAPQPTSSTSSSTSSSGSESAAIPANATVIGDIQKLTNWGNCSSSCAGQSGTNAIYSMEQP
ncbi:MAG: hypothetical protein ACRDRL_23455, partial [Sciscionella sp.]